MLEQTKQRAFDDAGVSLAKWSAKQGGFSADLEEREEKRGISGTS